MSEYDKQDRECEAMQKQHGPGGQLPTLGKPTTKKEETGETCFTANPHPVEKRGFDLRACVKNVAPVALLSTVVCWWQQSGQLAETTGFYALIVLALIGGVTIGKYVV